MKKLRIIEIKHPKLQKIRNEFRRVIFLACKEKKKEIDDKKWAIGKNPDGSYRKPTEEERKSIHQLTADFWAIESPLRKSIIRCAICGKLEGDRVFYPKFAEWYCPECHNKFYQAHEEFDPDNPD